MNPASRLSDKIDNIDNAYNIYEVLDSPGQDIQNNFEIKYIAFPTSVIYLLLSSGSGSLVDSFDL